MQRLSASDLMMIWPEQLGWSQDIGALLLLDGRGLVDSDGRLRLAEVQALISSRVHLLPRFCQLLHRPRRGLGWPLWIDAPRFDVAEHVRVESLAPGAREEELLDACERLRARRFDWSRPLWEMTFLTGLPEGRVGLFVKAHHAIADGLAGVAAFAVFLDLRPETRAAPAPPPWSPAPRPSAPALLADNLRGRVRAIRRAVAVLVRPGQMWDGLRRRWPALREMMFEVRAPRSSLNSQPIGWHRRYELLRGRLEGSRTVAHDHGGTINDVLMTVLAGGLRGLLLSRGEPVDGVVLRAAVPVALHDETTSAGNRDGMMAVPLPIGEADEIRRLERIVAETARRKQKEYVDGGLLFRNGVIQRFFVRVMGHQRFVNTYAANVPGPPVPLFLAGARVLEMFPIVPLQGNISIGVGALSYAGQFNITVVADRELVPDLDAFVQGAREAWARLRPAEAAVR